MESTQPKMRILGICGSASRNSSNLAILKYLSEKESVGWEMEVVDDLSVFPHFKVDEEDVPDQIVALRDKIEKADGVIICTPEYVFSMPSGLKNILEWCVSTIVFTDKPVGLITASASGEKGHEQLILVLKTIQAHFIDETTLLIQGVKSKVSREGEITNDDLKSDLNDFISSFKTLISKNEKVLV